MPTTINPTNSLTYQTLASVKLAGAEISAYDAGSHRLFTTSNGGLQIVDLSDPAHPALITTITFAGASDITSVATSNGLIAVSVPAALRTDPGKVYLLDANGTILDSYTVGALPDMVTFSPDGTKILVANEGEASFAGVTPYANPEGSVSVINLATDTVQTAGFTAFNGQVASLIAEGVRLFVNSPGFAGTTVAQDLEPEYIAIAPDGLSAMVTLQEANSVALLDLSGPAPVITDIVPLGLKGWDGLPFDGSDRDGPGNTQLVNFQTDQKIFGMYMPDAVASYQVGGATYYVMANEGDDRNDFVTETTTVGNNNYVIDPVDYPNFASLKTNGEIGRLTVPRLAGVNGDIDGDGKIDKILTYGGRSISIVDASGNRIFDSGGDIDVFVSQHFPELFDDGRSDNKGSEPEGVTIAIFEGRTYAFVALERFNSTIVYDITDPAAPKIATLLANMGDVAPESGIFISAADSGNGEALFVVSSETSQTLTVFQLETPDKEGGNGIDRLYGTIGGEALNGRNGDDFIYANAGSDYLFGGNGNDTLDGGWGNDKLYGGNGDDRLTTGLGSDVVHIGRGGGLDLVTDFNTDLDSIRLHDGVRVGATQSVDYNGDGNLDLVMQLTRGGGTLVLLGVTSAASVDLLFG
jgi:Ca2+-binding RTX toxin-like protein